MLLLLLLLLLLLFIHPDHISPPGWWST